MQFAISKFIFNNKERLPRLPLIVPNEQFHADALRAQHKQASLCGPRLIARSNKTKSNHNSNYTAKG